MAERSASIYVGYRAMSGRHRGFVVAVIVALAVTLPALAAVIAAAQRDPGDAVWDLATRREWTGMVFADPYPMLVDGDGTAWLLVGVGKFGVHDRVAPVDGSVCVVRGYRLERERRRIIEVDGQMDGIERTSEEGEGWAGPDLGGGTEARAIEVVGEIVDGKCFLGAMKPGDGKGHKACAVLCIGGGLPPLIAADVPGAGRVYPLLRVGGASVLPVGVLGLVGEPVRIEGSLSFVNGFPVVDARVGGIARVGRGRGARP